MLALGEIGNIEAALGRFKAKLEEADKARGGVWSATKDWLFDAFYYGGAPRSDSAEAATGRRLYKSLIAYRNRLVESPEPAHEEALEIISIANRAAKWNRAGAIHSYREATNVPGKVADAARKAMEEVGKGIKFIPILIALIVFAYLLPFLPRRAKA